MGHYDIFVLKQSNSNNANEWNVYFGDDPILDKIGWL